ncbi:hypothetical protein Sjap_004866 [Stephania japonica]|uniref:Protein SPIRAL1-like 5 n=1 Tax=Stephania japonica TaxID=461633 RepID=A0AAP0K4I3_9MAGN
MGSRGGSCGGGKSSLGYLFGSDHHHQPQNQTPASPSVTKPPWGDDNSVDNTEWKKIMSPTSHKQNHRAQGPNSSNFITERPSTRVQSVPGGDSSLGYLFGDK